MMPPRIIINGRFLVHKVTGVERYAREILAELDKIALPGEFELAIPPETKEIPHYDKISITKLGKLHNRLWEHISFPLYVKKKRAISLNLCNVAPLLLPGIAVIMDLKIRATPQFYGKKFIFWYRILFANVAYRAKKIITISEFSKHEFCRYYNANPNKICVIPCAWQHFTRIKYDEHALEKHGLKKDSYYFSISSLEPNKNFKWIAEAAKQNPDHVFAVAGSINETIFANGLGFECPLNMKLLGYVSDEEAKTLMRDCKAFLFPTFYEGFGMPPLEAMSAGCKCIVVSDTEIMHEVFGDAINYVNPNVSPQSMIYKNLTEKDKEKILHKYSWKNSAMAIYKFFHTINNVSQHGEKKCRLLE